MTSIDPASSGANYVDLRERFARARGWTVAREYFHSWTRPGDLLTGFNRRGRFAALLIHACRPCRLEQFIEYAAMHHYRAPELVAEPSWHGPEFTLVLLEFR